MRRRRLLALLGTATTAGCLDRGSGDGPREVDVASLFADRCESITDTSGDPVSLPDAPTSCPAYTDAWPSYCDPDAPLVLTAEGGSIELPRDSVGFTLRNQGERPFVSDFECVQLYKYVGGEEGWRLAQRPCNNAGFTLEPGEERAFELTVDNREICSTTTLGRWTTPTAVTVRAFGPGQYRFLLNGQFGEGSDMEQVSVSAPISVTGPALPLVPGPDVTSVTVQGKEATVGSRQFEQVTGRDRYLVNWERINKDALAQHQVVVESGYESPAIRQPFPFFDLLEDVNTIHHETSYDHANKGVVDKIQNAGALERIRYNGNVYRMTVTEARFR